jgi:lipoprotein-anchoring transpeptidase ErfK/SrfK
LKYTASSVSKIAEYLIDYNRCVFPAGSEITILRVFIKSTTFPMNLFRSMDLSRYSIKGWAMNFHLSVLHVPASTVAGVLTAGVLLAGAATAAPLPISSGRADDVVYAVMHSDSGGESSEGAADLAPRLQRQVVAYATKAAAGTVIIDTARTYLYFVLGDGRAIRYGIGVGREGFTWSGAQTVTRKAEWPDWTPPGEMIARQPYLPRWMAGGDGNPLGARAIYLGNTVYRIHGTNMPETIGRKVSSGCIRMLNEDVIDLYNRVGVGTEAIVLPGERSIAAIAAPRARGGLRASGTY